jgi:acetate kinase
LHAARTVCSPVFHHLHGERRIRGPTAHAALVQHEQHWLCVLAALAAQVSHQLLHLVEVEFRVLEVLVEHADVGAVNDGVKRAVPFGPLHKPATQRGISSCSGAWQDAKERIACPSKS